MKMDYNFLADAFCQSLGIHTRIYKKGQKSYEVAMVKLPFDPVVLVEDKLFASDESCDMAISTDGSYYGIIRAKDGVDIVIGPGTDMSYTRQQTLMQLLKLGESREYLEDFYQYYSSFTPMYSWSFSRALAGICYLINHEKPGNLFSALESDASVDDKPKETNRESFGSKGLTHGTYEFETELFSYIEHGNLVGLNKFFKNTLLMGNVGKVADNTLRQQKNITIVSITLASRAAMKGGADKELCYNLSDKYIQYLESTNSFDTIQQMSSAVFVDFLNLAARARCGKTYTKLSSTVQNYIYSNIDSKITTQDIADHVGMDRTQLCKKFKQHTGKSVAEFITELKTEEAKRLLDNTQQPLVSIANYLAYSSQSHFQNSFKKHTGMTPTEYRNREA